MNRLGIMEAREADISKKKHVHVAKRSTNMKAERVLNLSKSKFTYSHMTTA